MITERQPVGTEPSSIIIGGSRGHSRAPDGSAWLRNSLGLPYQNETVQLYNAVLLVHNQHVPCFHARDADLQLLDATLELIPPSHLRYVLSQRTAGIRVSDSTGRGSNLSYTGGSNPVLGFDDPETTDFIEENGILITFGAFLNFEHLGICPTVFHEFGHRMLHENKLSGRFSEEARAEMRVASHSRSASGDMTEALCDAYMYMLCYGAADSNIRTFGDRASEITRCRATRAVLRRCEAFNSMVQEDGWLDRYAERGLPRHVSHK